MAILSLIPYTTGEIGLTPRMVRLYCTDTYAEVTALNYLSPSNDGGVIIQDNDFIFAAYGTNGNTMGIFVATVNSSGTTLSPISNPGEVSLIGSAVTGNFTVFADTTGNIKDLGYLPSDATKTRSVMASAAVLANHIACFSDAMGTVNDDPAIAINGGDLQAGLNAVAGKLRSYSATTTTGYLEMYATANSGAFTTGITNAAMGQNTVLTVPNPGAATANFLLDTGAANIVTDYQEFVGLNDILLSSVGTWTMTRVAEGNYALVHTPADETSIIGIDIAPQLRAAAGKGFKLDSIDVIYSIGILALDAHTFTLDTVSYANNVAVSVVAAGAGALSTATQANPYVTNVTPVTPAFLNTACAKYVFEVTVNAAATSTYSFYGLNLHFSKTIS